MPQTPNPNGLGFRLQGGPIQRTTINPKPYIPLLSENPAGSPVDAVADDVLRLHPPRSVVQVREGGLTGLRV